MKKYLIISIGLIVLSHLIFNLTKALFGTNALYNPLVQIVLQVSHYNTLPFLIVGIIYLIKGAKKTNI